MNKSVDAFRTISEVAKELGLATHVLRFWESKFPQIKPLKRAGGRRYYRPDDVALLRRLQSLLHDEGYTIKGVQKLFREEGARKFIDEGVAESSQEAAPQENLPQASLFDAPAANGEEEFEGERPAPAPSEDVPTSDTTDAPFHYSPDLLPDAPEPVPLQEDRVLARVIETETVIQYGLSEKQRGTLNDILSELKALKQQIDNAA